MNAVVNVLSIFPGVPLLVLVESAALLLPVEAWLEQELATSRAACIGEKKVDALPENPADRQDALSAGIQWLASHSAKQPPLKARYPPKFLPIA